ncbi:unnamed protein product [Rotaria sp. Silwood1]|nr:unnamed protein product [Rotaria sp. Silwood1]CAF1425877.1 unnamed protein product [Rotaria sp. Silwood1]
MERMIDDIIDQISSVKCFHSNVTCLLNLPNKILLMIYRYLSVYGVLHCFYTSERSNSYLHDSIHDYYTKIYLGVMSFHECDYLLKLFLNSDNPLRSKSLILNNEHGFYLDRHYFFFLRNNIIQSIFIILTHLTVINCTFTDFDIIARHYEDFTKLEYLHATILKCDTTKDIESILIHMPNLRKLTLSIRDTLDSRFVHELKMESMLIKHVPHLDKFD